MKRSIISASNIDQRRLCPGSARAEAPFAEQDSEYSAEGTMLHALFMTGQRPEALTPEQVETLDLADFYADGFLKLVREQFGIPDDARFVDEREVALIFLREDGTPLEVLGHTMPGHADLIRTWPDHDARAVLDAKFGYRDVPEASSNYQLAHYGVTRQQQSPVASTGVAIIAPRNFGTRVTHCFYTAAGLAAAAGELRNIFYAALDDNAPVTAGEKQCHFCKAKTVCEEYSAQYASLANVDARPLAIATLENDQLESLHAAIQYALKLKDDAKEEMVRRIEAGELPGYALKPGNTRRKIVDPMKAFAMLDKAVGADVEGLDQIFIGACELSMTKLKPSLAKALCKPQTQTEKLIRETLAPVTAEEQNAPSIVKA